VVLSGFPLGNNTPSPGSTVCIVSDLALGAVVDGADSVTARHSKKLSAGFVGEYNYVERMA
jgi:hypothetical protein